MKDLYQDLLRYYRFMIGKIPNEESFLAAIKETAVSYTHLDVYKRQLVGGAQVASSESADTQRRAPTC